VSSDPFKILGISATASVAEIKAAYRQMAKKCHPDTNPGRGDDGKVEFARLSDAYSKALSQAESGREREPEPEFRSSPKGPKSRSVVIQITLDDVMTGKAVPFRSDGPCGRCQGSGFVNTDYVVVCHTCNGDGRGTHRGFEVSCDACQGVGGVNWDWCPDCQGSGWAIGEGNSEIYVPPGTVGNETIRIRAVNGDTIAVHVELQPHAVFTRSGNDLEARVEIRLSEAGLGTSREMILPGGRQIKITIPKGIAAGQRMRLRGAGLPSVDGKERGDLFVTVAYRVPSALQSEGARLAFEALRDAGF